MEQSKWIIVRRETTFEKFKRKMKNFILNFFGIELVTKEEQYKTKNKPVNKKEITIEILL